MTLNWDDTNQKETHVVEFSVQRCTHWTAPRSERHADAWAETGSQNGKHLKDCDRVASKITVCSTHFRAQAW